MTTARRPQLRRIGWLLTPLVVWAASFLGAWGGAVLARRFAGGAGAIGWMAGGALGVSVVAVVLWVQVLRRGAHRREDATEPQRERPR